MSVLFISDLHLEAERPDITRAFLSFLDERARRAEALYILGDFFEAWIGDDGMDAFQRSIAQSLRQGGRRRYAHLPDARQSRLPHWQGVLPRGRMHAAARPEA